jgi:hypothetical protein
MLTQNTSNYIPKLHCELCDFKCCKKGDWSRHISTAKHINAYALLTNTSANKYECECGSSYAHRQSLYTHKKKCSIVKTNHDDTVLITLVSEVVKSNNELQKQNQELYKQTNELQKQNQEMQKQILDVCKKGIINTTNNVNSNNKTFNLQVFLNEDCKDAMNITDFVDSIKFQLADLEHMGQVGYVEGISNIIIKNMKALDITKRPVHCTDQKRETIYIKDEGVWIKEEEDNKNVRKLIKRVAFRNSKCIRLFKEKYPDCVTSESRYSDTYNKIVLEAMGGGPKCDDYESENKIIKKLSKIVTIDKYNLS